MDAVETKSEVAAATESAGEPEAPAETQEIVVRHKKFTAAERVAQLESTIEKIRRQARLPVKEDIIQQLMVRHQAEIDELKVRHQTQMGELESLAEAEVHTLREQGDYMERVVMLLIPLVPSRRAVERILEEARSNNGGSR